MIRPRTIFFLLIILIEFLFFGTAYSTVTMATIPLVELYAEGFGAGRISMHYPNTFISTGTAEESVLFGIALQAGTAGEQVKKFSSASGVFKGVAGYSIEASLLSSEMYSAYDPVGIVESGFVGVYVEEAVAIGDPVRVRHTNHASDATLLAGQFATTEEAGKTATIDNCEFRSATTGAGIAILFLKGGDYTVTADTL